MQHWENFTFNVDLLKYFLNESDWIYQLWSLSYTQEKLEPNCSTSIYSKSGDLNQKSLISLFSGKCTRKIKTERQIDEDISNFSKAGTGNHE